MTCNDCKHADPLEDKIECRRYPPVIVPESGRPSSFPVVQPDMSCGEWSAVGEQ